MISRKLYGSVPSPSKSRFQMECFLHYHAVVAQGSWSREAKVFTVDARLYCACDAEVDYNAQRYQKSKETEIQLPSSGP
ncbi:hypothetical protein Peur_073610 [Populus x canadensis]